VFEKYMRFWNMMSILHKEPRVNKRRMVVTVFNQYAEELEALLASNIISYTNETFPDTPVGKKSDSSISSLIHQSLDSVALSPGSPKLNTAMGLLLKDPQMLKQMEWVKCQIETKKLKSSLKDLIEKRQSFVAQLDSVITHLEKLVQSWDRWQELLGKDDLEKRKTSIIQRELQLEKEIAQAQTQIDQVIKELANLNVTL